MSWPCGAYIQVEEMHKKQVNKDTYRENSESDKCPKEEDSGQRVYSPVATLVWPVQRRPL